ncbi:hypothetical protein [Nannocystis pusilla]|uniref:hypothetical protein n=1 Tax=Nannocystis pusilla TaxID=889268 RepID=UPI003BEFD9C7
MPSFTKNIPGPLKQSIKTPNEQPNGSPHEPPNGAPNEQPNLAPAGPAPAQQVSPPNSATQPGEAAPPAKSPTGKGSGLGFLKGLIGPKSQASPGTGGFASTAPAANSAGGTWSMGQIIFSPSFPPTISFQSSGGPSAGPNFGGGNKPGQSGKTAPGKQPTGPSAGPPGQPGAADSSHPSSGQPAVQPGTTDSNQPPSGQPAGQPDKPSGSPSPDSSDPTQQPGPPPKLPEATPEDIAHFKSASKAHSIHTEDDELAWIRHLKDTKPQIYGHVPDDELHAVLRYTGSDYDRVNTALRSQDPDPKWGGYERTVNAALAKLPKYKGPVVRGCELPAAIDQKWQTGEVVSDPGFVSTAAASESPVAFRSRHEIYIESKTGVYIEDLSYFGHHNFDPKRPKYPPGLDLKRETEVLFPSNTKFRVVHREKMVILETEEPKPGSNDPPKLVTAEREVIYLVEE